MPTSSTSSISFVTSRGDDDTALTLQTYNNTPVCNPLLAGTSYPIPTNQCSTDITYQIDTRYLTNGGCERTNGNQLVRLMHMDDQCLLQGALGGCPTRP